MPLLIGGATTSRIHTAVKIDPVYDGPVVHVLDASRSVPVASEFINPDTFKNIKGRFKDEYAKLREDYEKRKEQKNYIPLAEARDNQVKIDWKETPITKPKFLGNKVVHQFSTGRNQKVHRLDALLSNVDVGGSLSWDFQRRRCRHRGQTIV